MRYGDKVREKRILKKLYEQTKYRCDAGVYFDAVKNRYIRYSCNSKRLRNQGDRKIRRLSVDYFIPSGRAYCKIYDYQWEIC